MTDELRNLINKICKACTDTGASIIINNNVYNYGTVSYADLNKYDRKTIYKSGSTLDVCICHTRNDNIEPVSVYFDATTWRNNSSVSIYSLRVKISHKFSEKKQNELINKVIDYYKNI